MGIPFWVGLVFVPACAALAGITGIALLVRFILFVCRRRPQRFFRPFYKAHLWLVPLVIACAAPLTLGVFVTRNAHTRGDESYYSGPNIDAKGDWILAERIERGSKPPPTPAGAERFTVHFRASDGVELRGFLVPPRDGVPPRAAAVLVHGLFRGGLEIETVGSMFRDLGVTVLLLELRNHGGSGTAICTFGDDERRDVLAAVEHVRSKPDLRALPLILFGVSLGASAVSHAAPAIAPPPAAIVLDSPMASLAGAAEHQMTRRIGIPQPFRFLIGCGLQVVGGFRYGDVVPTHMLAKVDPSVHVLIIGGTEDEMMSVDDVRQVFDSFRTPEKELWMCEGAGHGKSWVVAHDEYAARLAKLVGSLRSP